MAPAPAPQPTSTDLHVPVPVPSGGLWGIVDQITSFPGFGIIAAVLIIIGLGAYVFSKLPWKPIAIVLAFVLFMIIVYR